MRLTPFIMITAICLVSLSNRMSPSEHSIGFNPSVIYFKEKSIEFASAALRLKSAIAQIRNDKPETVTSAREALKTCRLQYKKIEFFIEYFFKSTAVVYNGPAKFEVEEPFMEFQTPIGLQVIESLLFEENVFARKDELSEQAEAIASSSKDIPSLLYGFHADDKQILESIRIELIRIYALGISGFDAPLLKSGIEESFAALEAVQFSLKPYLAISTPHTDSVAYYLRSSLHFLDVNKDFDTFDRLAFLCGHALPLQKHTGLFIKSMHLEQNSTGEVMNYDAAHLFSADAFNVIAFPGTKINITPAVTDLGRMLFNEKALSGNNKISCATCHQPEKHFTDALPKSIAFNGHSTVKRNASSLLYAAFQYEQFWDGRAKSLEEQVNNVLTNPEEMNGSPLTSEYPLYRDAKYPDLFKNAFPETTDSLITFNKISLAIAAFVSTLNPRNSPFDKYMHGDQASLSPAQARGFNLFMGKAQCGTCHFAPLFNGLVPPLYNLSELEILGTPKSEDFSRPEEDDDLGRYNVFPIEYYERAFKTPTVRNVSATAPYMHNGAFKTLEKVVEFYNNGGGRGIGLRAKNQTLSSSPLHLGDGEISDLVDFMRSLEDSVLSN